MTSHANDHPLTQRHLLDEIRPVNVPSADEVVYQALRRAIIGGLEPGTALQLKPLAARFQISTMPVRAAIEQLRSEGLVEKRPRRAAVVSSLSGKDFADIYTIRLALETAAVRDGVPRITALTLAQIDDQLRLMQNSIRSERPNTDAYLRGDWRLHDLCYAHSERPRLIQLIESHRRQSERYFRLYLADSTTLASDLSVQEEFVEACRSRDPHSAEVAIARMFAHTSQTLLSVLDTPSLPPQDVPMGQRGVE